MKKRIFLSAVVLTALVLLAFFALDARAQARLDNTNDPPPTIGILRKVGMSADGKRAFAGDSERNILVWDVPKRELVRVIRDPFASHDTNPCYAFSADGQFALVGNQEGTYRLGWAFRKPEHDRLLLWNLTIGAKVRAFDISKNESVSQVALSPDGKRALSVGAWKTDPVEGDLNQGINSVSGFPRSKILPCPSTVGHVQWEINQDALQRLLWFAIGVFGQREGHFFWKIRSQTFFRRQVDLVFAKMGRQRRTGLRNQNHGCGIREHGNWLPRVFTRWK